MSGLLAKSAVLASLALGVVAAPAAASTGQTAPAAPGGKYCAVQLGKAPAGTTSPVVARACSDTSLAEAKATMDSRHRATARARGETAVAANVVLMYLYENVNYNRDKAGRMTAIVVPTNCDTAGYRFEPETWWKDNVSSVVGGTSRCNTTRVFDKTQTNATVFKIHVEGP